MNRFGIFLALILSNAALFADTTALQHFETSTSGTALTTNILAAGLLRSSSAPGPGYWTAVNFTDGTQTITNMQVNTAAEQGGGFLRPIVIGTSTNTDSGATRGVRTTFAENKRRYAEWVFNTNTMKTLTLGTYLKLGPAGSWSGATFNSYDLIRILIENGDFMVLNLWDNTGPGPHLQVHTQAGKGSDSGTTNVYNPARASYIWVAMKCDLNTGANGRADVWFYDPATWIRIGTSTLSMNTASPSTHYITHFAFGDFEDHGVQNPTNYVEFDDIVWDDTGARWPIMPASYTQLAISGSRANLGTAITNATSGDWVIVPANSNAWTAGSTLSITKPCTIAGLGTNGAGTYFTNAFGADTTPLWSVTKPNTTISNLAIFGTNYSSTDLKGYGIETLTNAVHITDCLFKDLEAALSFNGRGSVRRCILVDNQRTGRHFGYIPGGDALWANDYPLSRTNKDHYVVWEDCGVEITSSMANVAASLSIWSAQEAASYIVRHCNVKVSKYNIAPMLDFHGNDPGIPTLRGCLAGQIYKVNVTIAGTATFNGKFVDGRGGALLIYSNVVSGATVLDDVTLREEDYPSPSIDSITNTYVFSNFEGASGTTPMGVINGTSGALAEGTQYFLIAPTGDYCTFSVPYPYGAAQDCSGGGIPVPGCCEAAVGPARPTRLRVIQFR